MIDKVLRWHLIKKIIFCLLLFYIKWRRKKEVAVGREKPLWILGMFRSGTTLITQVVEQLGFDLGSQSELLQAQGSLKELNPNGFYEDFIFADLSRFFFHLLGKQGDDPPTVEEVNKMNWNQYNVKDFIRFSLFHVYEDRINITNKIACYIKLINLGLDGYIRSKGTDPVIKIPMLSFLFPLLLKKWPGSKFLIVYRHPNAALKSSSILTHKNDDNLYIAYYNFLFRLREYAAETYFVSYDALLHQPEFTISQLTNAIGIKGKEYRNNINQLIDNSLVRNKPLNTNFGKGLNDCYNTLNKVAINI